MMLIAMIIHLHSVTFAPATCSAPRDIGGGMTVRTCEVHHAHH